MEERARATVAEWRAEVVLAAAMLAAVVRAAEAGKRSLCAWRTDFTA